MVYQGKLVGPEYGTLKEVDPGFSFECTVKGERLSATIIGAFTDFNYGYRIRFSDGYLSDFFCNDFGYWVDSANDSDHKEKLKQPYVPYIDAIKEDLAGLLHFQSQSEYHCYELMVGGVKKNIFVIFGDREDDCFDVHHSGRYQFSLYKTLDGEWHTRSPRPEPEGIDQELATTISWYIDANP